MAFEERAMILCEAEQGEFYYGAPAFMSANQGF